MAKRKKIKEVREIIQPNEQITDEQIIKEIEADNEKDYYRKLKKKNKNYLLKLSYLERERVARYIKDRFTESENKHNELSGRLDDWDAAHRMEREPVPGDPDGEMPNYRTPLSTVALETIHSNIMNVFFTPKDILNVLPTEEGDIPKVKKLGVFGNWSMKNELDLFTNVDRLFHSSDKNGECPYLVHWVKEYGVEIKRKIIFNPANPTKPLIDPDTQEPLYQEIEKTKLLYNGPKLEVFSRKDYIQPTNAIMDKIPTWEMRRIRLTYDEYLREELQGKMYPDSIKDIKGWGSADSTESNKTDYEDDIIPVGEWEKEFYEFYGRMRINIIKTDDEDKTEIIQELEDEFIAVVNLESETLCSLRKNKFPLKLRPIGVDYFIPDDEGRRCGIGVMEFMDTIQKAYDRLYNQFIFGVVQANNPFGFFSPLANQRDEKIKIQNGYLFPSANPQGVNLMKLPPPDASIGVMLEIIQSWAQLLFGISPYTAGVESKIDPTAPAKKAEIVVAQGNVRLNTIIKRKNKTLQDIFKRWFLLYKENMPPNKFMRIAGSGDNPFKFEAVTLNDFALKSIPDFELVGNILNANKTLEAQKAVAIYQLLAGNPIFSPRTLKGLQALHSLTKWLIDKMDETGLSSFLPEQPGEMVQTPEEENARFLQGDYGKPTPQEDHARHMDVHKQMLLDPNVPDEIKKIVASHIIEHSVMMRTLITQQIALQQMGFNPQMANARGIQNEGGPNNALAERTPTGTPQAPVGMGGMLPGMG